MVFSKMGTSGELFKVNFHVFEKNAPLNCSILVRCDFVIKAQLELREPMVCLVQNNVT